MTLLQPVREPARWLVRAATVPIADGETRIGEATGGGSQIEFIGAEGDAAFLAATAGKGGDYNPLPAFGQWCEANMIYGYNDNLVICRQSHNRTEHDPADVPALFMVYRADAADVLEWIAGEQVQVRTQRTYGGVIYECLQAHVTQGDWTPPVTPALWKVVVVIPTTPVWVRPTGAQDAYALDALATHNGRVWKSLMNANTYEPGVIGSWRDQSDPPLWIAPVGAIGLWQIGNVAWYNGAAWRCTAANNTYAPGVWGWVRV